MYHNLHEVESVLESVTDSDCQHLVVHMVAARLCCCAEEILCTGNVSCADAIENNIFITLQ